ncbi:c-type cytochrome [Alcaligenaceae bacterium]|nr:c-type cytochrome [Alcaligenaceae bacterium]
MSCADDKNCNETRTRRKAIVVLGLMLLIFLGLSAVSFLDSRNQVTPDTVSFDTHMAVQGKRVFQAYNCMGCHTIVGNGAYFGPDLTHLYASTGPAWLAAFLPSAANWPAEAALRAQLLNPALAADAGSNTLEAYLKKYPGAAERVHRRGGQSSHMPNLAFRSDEVGQLIAFLKYTSQMNTEGWPPKPKVDGLSFPQARQRVGLTGAGALAQPVVAAAGSAVNETGDPATVGEKLAKDYGCMACHSSAQERLVGPPWGQLYGSQVSLADGTTVLADDAYLAESIRQPDARIVAGYPPGIMPAYAALLNDDEINAIVAYVRSLQGEQK